MASIYDNVKWTAARREVLTRDGDCVLSWLGNCSGPLHVHHTSYDDPYNPDQLVAVCRIHHPSADALRRTTRKWKHCHHEHRYPGAREECERRMNRAA